MRANNEAGTNTVPAPRALRRFDLFEEGGWNVYGIVGAAVDHRGVRKKFGARSLAAEYDKTAFGLRTAGESFVRLIILVGL